MVKFFIGEYNHHISPISIHVMFLGDTFPEVVCDDKYSLQKEKKHLSV